MHFQIFLELKRMQMPEDPKHTNIKDLEKLHLSLSYAEKIQLPHQELEREIKQVYGRHL